MRLSDIMAAAGLSIWAQAALVLFLVAFVIIVIAVLAPSRSREFDRCRHLPLDDDAASAPDATRGLR